MSRIILIWWTIWLAQSNHRMHGGARSDGWATIAVASLAACGNSILLTVCLMIQQTDISGLSTCVVRNRQDKHSP